MVVERGLFEFWLSLQRSPREIATLVLRALDRLKRGEAARPTAGSTSPSVDAPSGIEFERLLAQHFRRRGYTVTETTKTGDFGADLILEDRDERVVVRSKRLSATVGVAAGQEAIAARTHYGAHRTSVVTNCTFSSAARKLAESSLVVLWDGSRLREELESSGLGALPATDDS